MRIALRLIAAALFAAFASSTANAQPSGIMAPGDAAVTAFSGVPNQQTSERIDRDGPSLRVVALPGSGPFGLVNAPKSFTAKARDIGQVFGVALDNQAAPDIFVSATAAYGLGIYRPGHGRLRNGAPGAQYTPGQFGPPDQGGGPGSIWRIDGQTGQVSLFANVAFNGIQNTPASLGALAFDSATQQLFVSDRATGLIHRFSMDGTDRGTFDHGVQGRGAAHIQTVPFDPATLANIENAHFDAQDPRSWGFAPPMRRVFALVLHNGRLFYSVMAGSQIWSVGIAGNGAFMDDAHFETAIPGLNPGVEISQIAFDGRGQMYVAERGATTGSPDFVAVADGGQNRVLRFQFKMPGDPSPGLWHAPADEYAIGLLPDYRNADGGVNLSCGRTLWSTGERLLEPANARPGSFPTIDGLQGNDSNLARPANTPPSQAWTVNYYDSQADPASRGHMGAIAIWNVCGGAPSSPPPGTGLLCPYGTFAIGGACLIAPVCPEQTIWRNGTCVFPRCPDGFVSIRGECRRPPVVCRRGEIYLRDRCVPIGCPLRLERADNGYCRCPKRFAYRDGQCAPPCPNGAVQAIGRPVDAQCPCPRDSVRDRNGRCTPPCSNGAVQAIGQPVNTQCPCPRDSVRDRNGRCTPPCQNSVAHPIGEPANAQCPCPRDSVRDRDGRCTPPCPNGAVQAIGQPVNTQCPCPKGDTRNADGRCVPNCQPGTVALANCPCPPGQKRNADGRCYTPTTHKPPHCPRGEYLRDGRCHVANRITTPPTIITHTTVNCGRGERLEDGRCVPSSSTGTTTVTTHECPDGETYRHGHCVSSGGSTPGLGCSREVYDRLGHCPTSHDNNGTPDRRDRSNGGNNDGRFPQANQGNKNRGNRYPNQDGNSTPR